MASPAEEALVADIAGKTTRGSAYGLYLTVASLGASIGPLLGGFLYVSNFAFSNSSKNQPSEFEVFFKDSVNDRTLFLTLTAKTKINVSKTVLGWF